MRPHLQFKNKTALGYCWVCVCILLTWFHAQIPQDQWTQSDLDKNIWLQVPPTSDQTTALHLSDWFLCVLGVTNVGHGCPPYRSHHSFQTLWKVVVLPCSNRSWQQRRPSIGDRVCISFGNLLRLGSISSTGRNILKKSARTSYIRSRVSSETHEPWSLEVRLCCPTIALKPSCTSCHCRNGRIQCGPSLDLSGLCDLRLLAQPTQRSSEGTGNHKLQTRYLAQGNTTIPDGFSLSLQQGSVNWPSFTLRKLVFQGNTLYIYILSILRRKLERT